MYFLFFFAAVNLLDNIFNNVTPPAFWPCDLYTTASAITFYLLTPNFLAWWKACWAEQEPILSPEQKNIQKKYRRKVFLLLGLYILAIIILTPTIPEPSLLLFLMATGLFILLLGGLFIFYKKKGLFIPVSSNKNTQYVFMTAFLSWIIGFIVFILFGFEFALPALLVILISLILSYFIRGNSRFLIPGISIISADYGWRFLNLIIYSNAIPANANLSDIIIAKLALGITILLGIIWLVKRPGVLPILFLTIISIYRYASITFFIFSGTYATEMSKSQLTSIVIFLSFWIIIAPLLFWFLGIRERWLR